MKKVNLKINYYSIITLLGILLSVIWVIMIDTKPFSDFQYYNNIAKQVANGGQWGNTYTSVGYPIVLGFVYKIFGDNLLVGKVFNIFLTFLNYLIVYKTLKKINMNEKNVKSYFFL